MRRACGMLPRVRCRAARFKGLVIAAIKVPRVPPERSHAIQSISTSVGERSGTEAGKKKKEEDEGGRKRRRSRRVPVL